jgi:hypothetical protein
MSDWQPIETAPRDGSPILIYQPDYDVGGERAQHRTSLHWRVDASGSLVDGPGVPVDDHRYAIGYWRPWGGWGNRNSARVNPTHWMPLPPVPVKSSSLSERDASPATSERSEDTRAVGELRTPSTEGRQ